MLAVAAHLCPVTAAAAALSHDPFTRAHGRAALRFQCSIAIYLASTNSSKGRDVQSVLKRLQVKYC